jgi:hypothetical protein
MSITILAIFHKNRIAICRDETLPRAGAWRASGRSERSAMEDGRLLKFAARFFGPKGHGFLPLIFQETWNYWN